MGVKELERHLRTLEPDEIEARYGASLDPEARTYFESFKATCAKLDQLSQAIEQAVPPMPTVRKPNPILVFLRRPIVSPAWALPLAAAAVLCLGLLLPRPSAPAPVAETKPVEIPQTTPSPAPSLLDPVRAAELPDTLEQNARIADAFLERAQVLQERREFALAWHDYVSALEVMPAEASPQRDQLLEELQILAESLHDQVKLDQVLALRKATQ